MGLKSLARQRQIDTDCQNNLDPVSLIQASLEFWNLEFPINHKPRLPPSCLSLVTRIDIIMRPHIMNNIIKESVKKSQNWRAFYGEHSRAHFQKQQFWKEHAAKLPAEGSTERWVFHSTSPLTIMNYVTSIWALCLIIRLAPPHPHPHPSGRSL